MVLTIIINCFPKLLPQSLKKLNQIMALLKNIYIIIFISLRVKVKKCLQRPTRPNRVLAPPPLPLFPFSHTLRSLSSRSSNGLLFPYHIRKLAPTSSMLLPHGLCTCTSHYLDTSPLHLHLTHSALFIVCSDDTMSERPSLTPLPA